MLVHRKNDDQSGGKKPVAGDTGPNGEAAKPRLVDAPLSADPGPSDPTSLDGSGEADAAAGEDGKTHMIGDALKSVYQRTLEEEIPDDFLDLLKQLK
jgi:hypothetical protein